MTDATTRHDLLEVAKTYEAMAEQVERVKLFRPRD
jgi:hypothetical protein